MANSTGPRELHVDQHLTNLAINYRPQNLIADMIAPIVPVQKQRDTYPVYSRFETFAIEDTKRGPGAEAKKITRSVGSAFYQAENYALGSDVTIEDVANVDAVYRGLSATGKSRFLMDKLLLSYEKRVLDMVAASTAVGSTFVCNSAFIAAGGAAGQNAGDPFAAFEQMCEYQKQTTNQRPNGVIIGWRAWGRIKRNYHMRNLLNGTNNGGGPVTRQAVQNLFEVDRFIIADAMWQTANEAQTAVTSFYNPLSDMMIAYFAPSAPSIDDPSWMYSFRWTNPVLPAPMTVFRHPYDSRRRIDTIEVDYYQDERIVGADYAVGLLTNVASGALGIG